MNQLNQKLDGKKILVVGLARSGTAAARLAEAFGASVTVTDTRPEHELKKNLDRLGSSVRVSLGKPPLNELLDTDLIVISPGVPPDQEWLREAAASGIDVISEVELAYTLMDGEILGITGSNGKTTTSLLTGDLLTAAGIDNEVAGNVGFALSEAVLKARQSNRRPIFITELSSFQLEKTSSLRCRIAVFLNCTPDHLDRYGDFESYRNTKLRIFLNQAETDFAVINGDDSFLMETAEKLRARIFPFSLSRKLEAGVFLDGPHFWARRNGSSERLIRVEDLRLRGTHNLENAAAALAASFLAGADTGTNSSAVRDFRGPEHRLEFVATIDGVDYFNDSKSTTAQSTLKALLSFSGNIILIMGGYDKGEDFSLLKQAVAEKTSLLVLIGNTAEKIRSQLEGSTIISRAASLEQALRTAYEQAKPGDTVLLSPACASFDMFNDFEHRGKAFKSLVSSIASRGKRSISEVNSA